MEIILASTSKFRQKLLQDFNIPFRAVSPLFDEESNKTLHLPGPLLCEQLAFGKASSLLEQHAEDIIVGSDQMACLNGQLLGKAGTKEKAYKQLFSMQGQTHQLITSLCVLSKSKKYLYTDITTMRMKPLTREQVELYVEQDQTWDCAGSYKLEKTGHALFESIECKDESAIIGLPILALKEILTKERFESIPKAIEFACF